MAITDSRGRVSNTVPMRRGAAKERWPMFWQPATHAPDVFTDTDLGQYLIRAYQGHCRLYLNGKRTEYRGSANELKATVEWIVAGRIIANLAKQKRRGQIRPSPSA